MKKYQEEIDALEQLSAALKEAGEYETFKDEIEATLRRLKQAQELSGDKAD